MLEGKGVEAKRGKMREDEVGQLTPGPMPDWAAGGGGGAIIICLGAAARAK